MTRRSLVTRCLSLVAALLAPIQLRAQDTGWRITGFHADYTIGADRTIEVTERIDVDFGPLEKHGIYREINTRYRRVGGPGAALQAGTVDYDLELLGVTDGQGRNLQTSVERGGRFRVRIGDPDVTISGPQTYLISYRLEKGLGFFDAHDELYWQVTGTEWPVPIERASARVRLPEHQPADSGYAAWCYAGWAESNASDRCTAEATASGEFRFSATQLDPGEGLTLVAAFPKGIVPEPTAAERTRERLGFWWPAALPILALLGMLRQWNRTGREPPSGSIVPQWKPPEGLPPGAAGTLVDQRAGMDDIVATMLDLAVRGYVTIREVPPEGVLASDSFVGKALRSLGLGKTDWEVTTTDKSRNDLTRYEKMVYAGVLEGATSRKMSDLHNDFYKHIPKIYSAMYDETVERGLFLKRPESTRNKWLGVGFGVMVLAPLFGFPLRNAVLAIALVLAGLVVVIFAHAMPAMTPEGAKQYAAIKGLKEYITRAEKLELEMSQAPRKTTQLFETLLPYAVALKVSDIWLDQFASVLASQPPTWYVGAHPGTFNAASFKSTFADFTTAASRTMGSSPGSSSGSGGGGSVGGGGGGGGGGSW